ncbi:hypothetical protein HGRIS_003952 [Hohenbuehelia grisea]|uniref:F-box domain-containing protein n=1 Tax=Hohenbuehelia grisea TaxID=104357 RepID=A0ABR3JH79_9AGAR
MDSLLGAVIKIVLIYAGSGESSSSEQPPSGPQVQRPPKPTKSPKPTSPPMDLLPSEILSDIFSYCLPDLLGGPQAQSFRRSRAAPLTLLRVCRRWRDVVVTTPVLWTCIAVEQTKQGCAPPLPVLQQWLKRSGACGLSLDVLVHSNAGASYSSAHAAQMFKTLLAVYSRWREVRLCVPTSLQRAVQGDILHLESREAPMLESLSFTLEMAEFETSSPGGILDVEEIVARAPRLTNLAWDYQYPTPMFRAGAGWSRLTRITTGTTLALRDCYSFLQACPQLESCHLLRAYDGWALGGDATPPLTMSRLKELFIITKSADFQPLLDLLTLPALRSLELSRVSERFREDDRSSAPLRHLALRSEFTLEHLVLHNLELNESELIGFLKMVSESLTELDVLEIGTRISARIIYALTLQPHPEKLLCPQLKMIKLRGGVAASDGQLIAMVQSRRNPRADACVLKDIQVEFNEGGGHFLDRAGLRALRKDGLRAYIF